MKQTSFAEFKKIFSLSDGYVYLKEFDLSIPSVRYEEVKNKFVSLKGASEEEVDKYIQHLLTFCFWGEPIINDYDDSDPWKANQEYLEEVMERDD